jgi:anti-sigma factor RsiW
MSKDPQNIQEIDQYLSGELSPEARNEFEKKLKEDPSLREELNTTINVIEGIQGYAFKNMLKDLHKKLF